MRLFHQPQRLAGQVHVVADIGLVAAPEPTGRSCMPPLRGSARPPVGAAPASYPAAVAWSAMNLVTSARAIRIGRSVRLRHADRESVPACSDAAMKALHLRRAHRMVQRIRRRHRADQDQHDQPHALLPVVRSVKEAHARAGQHHQRANRPRRRLIAFRRFIKRRNPDQPLRKQESADAGQREPSNGEISSAFENLHHLCPSPGPTRRCADSSVGWPAPRR